MEFSDLFVKHHNYIVHRKINEKQGYLSVRDTISRTRKKIISENEVFNGELISIFTDHVTSYCKL